jgi:hypothetical protein
VDQCAINARSGAATGRLFAAVTAYRTKEMAPMIADHRRDLPGWQA